MRLPRVGGGDGVGGVGVGVGGGGVDGGVGGVGGGVGGVVDGVGVGGIGVVFAVVVAALVVAMRWLTRVYGVLEPRCSALQSDKRGLINLLGRAFNTQKKKMNVLHACDAAPNVALRTRSLPPQPVNASALYEYAASSGRCCNRRVLLTLGCLCLRKNWPKPTQWAILWFVPYTKMTPTHEASGPS